MLKVFSFSEIVSFTLLSLFLHTLLFLIVFLFSDFFLSLHYFSDSILFYFILLFFIFFALCLIKKRVVLVHDTRSNDSRSNGSRFMHKLCLSLDATDKPPQGDSSFMASKTPLHNSNRA